MSTQWYADPRAPGVPRVGDLVVAVGSWFDLGSRHDCVWMGYLVLPSHAPGDPQPWSVMQPGLSAFWAHHVRRPTESELAAWALGGATEPQGCQWPPPASPEAP